MKKSSVFHKDNMILGEGLYVDVDALFWLDITQSQLMKKTYAGHYSVWDLPEQASAIWKVEKQIVFLASESGLCLFDLICQTWSVAAPFSVRDKMQGYRANDGGEICKGQYLFGTMQKKPDSLSGSLYWTDGYTVEKISNSIGIPNSFIKINNNEILISDSYQKLVYKYIFDCTVKNIDSKIIWLDLREQQYVPDGGSMDKEGNVYIAMWGGACVNKYDQDAQFIESYSIPAIRPTNCVLSVCEKYLYVTTAREGLSTELLEKYPDSGSVFKISLD